MDSDKVIKGLKELFDRPEFTGEQKIRIATELVGKRQVARFLALIKGIGNLEEDLAIQAISAGNAIEKQAVQKHHIFYCYILVHRICVFGGRDRSYTTNMVP